MEGRNEGLFEGVDGLGIVVKWLWEGLEIDRNLWEIEDFEEVGVM